MAKDDLESSTGGRNVPQTHKLPINIRQPQGVSLMMWVPPWVRAAAAHVGDAVAAVVARLPRGRSRIYDRDAITGVAEDLILISVNMIDKQDWFIERVWRKCKRRNIRVPKKPDATALYDICSPIYKREHAKIEKSNFRLFPTT